MGKLRLHLQPQNQATPERTYVQRLVKAAMSSHEEPGVFIPANGDCLKFMNARELQDVSIWVHMYARAPQFLRPSVVNKFDQSVSKLEFHLHSRRGETYRFSFSPDRLPSTAQGKRCFEIPGLVKIEIGAGDRLTRAHSASRQVA